MRPNFYTAVAAVLVLLILSGASTAYSGLESYLEKGDKLTYEITYYEYNSPVSTDYYEVDISDKFVSTELYFSLDVQYSGYYGSREKTYKSIKTFDLPMYIPAVPNIDYIDFSATKEILLTIPIPIKNWNSPIDGSSPIAAKAISLRFDNEEKYRITIGNVLVNLVVVVLRGNDNQYSFKAYIDRGSGILVRLDAFNQYGEYVFSVNLVYYTQYVELGQGFSSSNVTTTTIPVQTTNRITSIVMISTIVIVALLFLYARVK